VRCLDPAHLQADTKDYDDILQAFAQARRAALLDRPGTGKTTTLRKLAADLAQRALGDPAAPLPLPVKPGRLDGRGRGPVLDRRGHSTAEPRCLWKHHY
jgi:predicted NACHT family NTPase